MENANRRTSGSSNSSCTDLQLKESMYIMAATLYSIIFLLGVVGNGVVIWITGFKMTKTISTVWFLNLAIADFIFVAMRIFSVVREMMQYQWPFGRMVCRLTYFVKYLNMFSSVFILMVISIDRCVLVNYPVFCRKHRTVKTSSVAISVVWAAAILLSSPYMIFTDVFLDIKNNQTKCTYTFGNGDINYKSREVLILYIVRFIVGFVVPFVVITVSYVTIGWKVKGKNWAKTSRMFKIILITMVAFFICWLPYHIFTFLKRSSLPKCHLLLGYRLAASLAYFNSCLNPILYFFVGFCSRRNFPCSLLSVLKNAFSEDSEKSNDSQSFKVSVQLNKYTSQRRPFQTGFWQQDRYKIGTSCKDNLQF
ncbi:UNVERIFIED_CONTAM: hypothetical protein FKN15_010617 [Acipenser sinensis]